LINMVHFMTMIKGAFYSFTGIHSDYWYKKCQ
jgi:hypothetical protein